MDVLRSRRIGLSAHGIEGAVGPAEQLFEYLVCDAGVPDVAYVRYPLDNRNPGAPVVRMIAGGVASHIRTDVVRRTHPPASFLLDSIDRFPRNCDVWIAFDPLLALKASCWPGRHRRCVVSWHVDFAPDRGSDTASRLYRTVDRLSFARCDLQVDISEAARAARRAMHPGDTPAHIVVPFATSPVSEEDLGLDRRGGRTVVFAGALERRTGAHHLPAIAASVIGELADARFVVIGDGSLRAQIEADLASRHIADQVRMLGFINSHEEMLETLSQCDIAVAPYDREHAGFSRYSDPGKVKTYLSCGLPVVASDVITNARELFESGAGVIAASERSDEWAKLIVGVLGRPEELAYRTRAAMALASSYSPASVYRAFALELAKILRSNS